MPVHKKPHLVHAGKTRVAKVEEKGKWIWASEKKNEKKMLNVLKILEN